jgi:transcriptional regulator with XRE-family HTH domain
MPLDPKDSRQIKAAIVGAGLRQREVAHEAGIDPDRLSKVLTGYRPPHPGELSRVVDAIVRLRARDE